MIFVRWQYAVDVMARRSECRCNSTSRQLIFNNTVILFQPQLPLASCHRNGDCPLTKVLMKAAQTCVKFSVPLPAHSIKCWVIAMKLGNWREMTVEVQRIMPIGPLTMSIAMVCLQLLVPWATHRCQAEILSFPINIPASHQCLHPLITKMLMKMILRWQFRFASLGPVALNAIVVTILQDAAAAMRAVLCTMQGCHAP